MVHLQSLTLVPGSQALDTSVNVEGGMGRPGKGSPRVLFTHHCDSAGLKEDWPGSWYYCILEKSGYVLEGKRQEGIACGKGLLVKGRHCALGSL